MNKSMPAALRGAPTIKELASLVRSLKPEIYDDFRASDDPDDDTPAILLTIGADASSWSYQTGDNSYTGGAYGFAHWGIGTVTRHCNSREVAREILDDLASQLY